MAAVFESPADVVSDELLVALLDEPVRRIDGTATATATSAARMIPKMTMQQIMTAALLPLLVTAPPSAGTGMATTVAGLWPYR